MIETSTTNFTTPLPPETINKVTEELNALEQKPVNGWDLAYPTLFTTLNDIIADISTRLNHATPGLVIIFQGPMNYQGAAYIMTDGSTQLHLGAHLIRKFLLNPAPEGTEARYRAFVWTIAHEITHLCDPNFQRFGRLYKLRIYLDLVVNNVFFFSALMLIINYFTGASNRIYGMMFITTSCFMLIKKAFLMALHWNFEYTADRLVLQAFSELDQQDAKLALEEIVNDIKKSSLSASGILARYQTFKLFHLHPPLKKRLARMKK